jgi:hypothetical protein
VYAHRLMLKPRDLFKAAFGYVRRNPDEIVHAAVNATSLRFGVPLAALRWVAEQLPTGKRAPTDIEIGSVPPAIRLGGTIDAMGTSIRATASVRVDDIQMSGTSVKVGLRVKDLKLELIGESLSPVGTLIKSGALDLSKPGNVVKFLPKKPDFIVEADDDRIVIDLLKAPKLAENAMFRRILATVTPVLNIGSIETENDHLYVRLKASPSGLPQSLEAFRKKS